MIIFVTTTKPFQSIFKNIQKNALNSWNNLNLEKKIIVLSDDNDCKEFCEKNGFICIDNYEKSDISGIPTYRSLIYSAISVANDSDLICQINSDIILCNDFSETINEFENQIDFKQSALVGQRFDCNFDNNIIDFSSDWESNLPDGEWHSASGIDYFVFNKSTFSELPLFYIARFTYDGWILGHLRDNGVKLIDCTKTIKAYHQNHGYGPDGNLNDQELVNLYKHEISENSKLSHNMNIDVTKYLTTKEFNKIIFKIR